MTIFVLKMHQFHRRDLFITILTKTNIKISLLTLSNKTPEPDLMHFEREMVYLFFLQKEALRRKGVTTNKIIKH